MRFIELTNGGKTKVDDDLYEYLSSLNWQLSPQGYACRSSVKDGVILMHRVIVNANRGEIVDHINQNKLDNQKINLRVVNRSKNSINSKMRENNTSGFRHVTWRKDTKKWLAQVMRNYRNYNLGSFDFPEDAALAAEKFINNYGE